MYGPVWFHKYTWRFAGEDFYCSVCMVRITIRARRGSKVSDDCSETRVESAARQNVKMHPLWILGNLGTVAPYSSKTACISTLRGFSETLGLCCFGFLPDNACALLRECKKRVDLHQLLANPLPSKSISLESAIDNFGFSTLAVTPQSNGPFVITLVGNVEP